MIKSALTIAGAFLLNTLVYAGSVPLQKNAVLAAQPTKAAPNVMAVAKAVAGSSRVKKPVAIKSVSMPAVKKQRTKQRSLHNPAKAVPKANHLTRAKPQPAKIRNIKVSPAKAQKVNARLQAAPMQASPKIKPKTVQTTSRKTLTKGRIEQMGLAAKQFDPIAIETAQRATESMGFAGMQDRKLVPDTGLTNQDDSLDLSGGDEKGFDNNGFTAPEPTAPNYSKGMTGSGAAIGGPLAAASPKEAMGGAASQDGGDPKIETRVSDDGTILTIRHSGNPRTGVHMIEATEMQPNGNYSQTSSHTNPDGSSSSVTTGYDADGNVTYRGPIISHYADGSPSTFDPRGNPNADNPDPDGKWARWQAKLMGIRPKATLDDEKQVNPGSDGAMPDNSAPQLVPTEEQLVGDPSLSAAREQRGGLDPATSRRMMNEAAPGPGERPPGESL